MSASRSVEALNAALPQTQCTRCGFADCLGYAQALAAGSADINQCPPGGAEGVSRLSALTGRPVLPLNPGNGREGPRHLAVIDEAECIGCTLCLQACPVDCIVGAPKAMHTVIAGLCTGCELCIPVCPVDCIALVAVTGSRTGWQAWSVAQAFEARSRYAGHRARTESPGVATAPPEPVVQTRARPDRIGGDNGVEAIAETLGAAAQPNADGLRRSLIDAALARARAARTGR